MPTATSSSNSGLPYLPGLDGLRALAVLVVVFYHAQAAWAVGGFLGVESFFVISGYLITSLLVREHLASQRLDLGRFWLRRARRRMGDALTLIPELAAQGKLAGTVVIHLGTNQPFDDSVFDGVMQSLVERGVTRVIFLTVKRPITWESFLNRKLAEGVARWPQAELADWNTIAQSQPGWFIADQVHPTTTGAEAYASLILQALGGH